MKINSGSFRDPSGSVFSRDGRIFRAVYEPGRGDYEAVRDAGVFSRLIEEKMLVAHEEIEPPATAPEGAVICLEHPRLPMISYPWEQPFSMLKDGALLHLEAMERLIEEGFWLRDASAFNVQYDGERVRLIDTLSVGPRPAESPWVAYGQFCGHFLAPLAMAAHQDIRTLSLWRGFIDGFPLDLAVRALPFWKRLRAGYFMHLVLHARFQSSADSLGAPGEDKPKKKPRVSDRGLIGLIRSLRKAIRKTRWRRSSKIWEGYEEIRTYGDDDVSLKRECVEKVVRRLRPNVVWDLGANTGEFSEIAARQGAFTVAIDGDAACAENIYLRHCRGGGLKNILPLTMDLANPSPSLGWDGQERPSLKERGPADLVFALALVHHLVLTCCVPLWKIAEWLRSLTSGRLLVEFVPVTDPMAQKLLESREEAHLPYGREVFEADFSRFFDIEDRTPLENGRILYLCKRR